VTRRLAAVLAVMSCLLPSTGAGQATAVLRIAVTLADADQRPVPVPRHALLVSDNPPTTSPRRAVTGLDGTAMVRVPPGNYTVESDQPLVFQGRQYVWTQTLDVVAGAGTLLALTAANSESGPVTASTTAPAGRAADLADALILWQDSVVGLWTPTTAASGVVVDARGLVVTNQQVIGAATSVEVQLTAALKLAGRVLIADRANDVAVLWVDPAALAKVTPVPLGCVPAAAAPLANGQEVVALGMPPGQSLRSTYGAVSRVASRAMIADLSLPRGSAGGPVFAAGGRLVGLTSFIAA
jgi:S1-C subfamily serine protease